MTTQPYVSRQPWISTATATTPADVEYSMTQTGTNAFFLVSGSPQGIYHNQGAENVFGHCDIGENYTAYLQSEDNLQSAPMYPHLKSNGSFAVYGGGYNTSAEVAFGNNAAGLQQLIAFIESLSAQLSAPIYYQRFSVNTPLVSDGFLNPVEADRLAINPYYTTARHDYT